MPASERARRYFESNHREDEKDDKFEPSDEGFVECPQCGYAFGGETGGGHPVDEELLHEQAHLPGSKDRKHPGLKEGADMEDPEFIRALQRRKKSGAWRER